MAARWTKAGWITLLGIADNAVAFTGSQKSGQNVIDESEQVWRLLISSKGVWKSVKNIYGEDRYWHPFNNGKVLYWKVDAVGPIFVGAFYSQQNPLTV